MASLEELHAQVGNLEKITRHGFADLMARVTQRARRPPLQLPSRALAQKFFGRGKLLAELIDRLKRREHIDIWGPAGMGKTTLAAEALYQVVGETPERLAASPYPDGVVLLDLYWLKGNSPDPAWSHLADAFDASLSTTLMPRERAITACRDRHALVVVEGAEEAGDGTQLQKLLAVLAPQTIRLVLTRDKRQASTARPLTVQDELNGDDGRALLRELCGHAVSASVIEGVYERLGSHPLALTWAGSQLGAETESPQTFLAALRAADLPALRQPGYEDHTLAWLYGRSVMRLTPDANRVLVGAGMLAQQPFPLTVGLAALGDDPRADETTAREALKQLVRYGLLRLNASEDEQWQFTHALAHQFARTAVDPPLLAALGQWAKEYFDMGVELVRSSGDFAPLSSALDHASALLRGDHGAHVLDGLAYKFRYDSLDYVVALGRLDFAADLIRAVHDWLQSAPADKKNAPVWQRESR